MTDYFAPSGPLADEFPGYRPRAGQVVMARAVGDAYDNGRHLMVEAPTGVGKSVAYLLPLAERAIRDEKRVMVVTANIALQEQLIQKDLPLVARVLERSGRGPLRFALAKGIGNYACLREVGESSRDPAYLHHEQRVPFERWLAETERGDVSELPFELDGKFRLKVTTGTDDCTGSKCPHAEQCFARKARSLLDTAHVVVGNYHLLFIDVKIQISSDGHASILPHYDALVMDEGHKAADIARDTLGFRITEGMIRWAVRLLAPRGRGPAIDSDLLLKIESGAANFFAELARFASGPKYKARLREDDEHPTCSGLIGDLLRARELLSKARKDGDGERKERLTRAMRRCAEIAISLNHAFERTESGEERIAFFLERDRRDRVTIGARPIDVAGVLSEWLFDKENSAIEAPTCIVTSATLRDGDRFDYIAGELGLSEPIEHDELVVESPFDYRKSAFAIPERFPAPSHPNFKHRVGEELCRVVRAFEGRTLGLFTSYAGLKIAAETLRRNVRHIEVMMQGDAPRTQLIQRFREDERSVLLGTESFWAGVDVPGPALSCVFIDKLPFVSPEDPVLSLISEGPCGKDSFFSWSIPRAIIQLRQGFGRLIRSTSDRGVVVFCDRRVIEKGYGQRFFETLPPDMGVFEYEDIVDVMTEVGCSFGTQAELFGGVK